MGYVLALLCYATSLQAHLIPPWSYWEPVLTRR